MVSFEILIRLLQITDCKPADFTSSKPFWVATAQSYPDQWNLACYNLTRVLFTNEI